MIFTLNSFAHIATIRTAGISHRRANGTAYRSLPGRNFLWRLLPLSCLGAANAGHSHSLQHLRGMVRPDHFRDAADHSDIGGRASGWLHDRAHQPRVPGSLQADMSPGHRAARLATASAEKVLAGRRRNLQAQAEEHLALSSDLNAGVEADRLRPI